MKKHLQQNAKENSIRPNGATIYKWAFNGCQSFTLVALDSDRQGKGDVPSGHGESFVVV
jgi:hypothetical protein